MRRMLLIAIAGSAFAVALAVPGVALAHHGHHHHHHAKHARVLHFGSIPTPTPPSSAPTTPSAPTPPAPAGTVKSFTEGVLTITLADGSTVSGKVTEETRLQCSSAQPGTENNEQDDQGEDSGDNHAHMSDNGGNGGDDNGAGDDREGGDANEQAPCTTSALTPGATVLGAELRVGGSGAVWQEVDILQ